MPQPDTLDEALAQLRQDLSNTLLMVNVAVSLRQNTRQLLQLLSIILRELCEAVKRTLPLLLEEDHRDA